MKTQTSKTLKVAFAAAAALARKKVALAVCAALCSVGLAFPQSDDNATFITFDAPGAFNAPGAGTAALSINPAGEITGFYLDANYEWHGFLRAADGTITSFDPPGSVFTFSGSINPEGAIVGTYLDANGGPHGFLRARDGSFTTFNPPGVIAPFTSFPPSINPAGAVAYYNDSIEGFVRAPDGTFTIFESPGASGTFATGINPAGTVAGYYFIVTINPFSLSFHSYVRTPDGSITSFDPPGSSSSGTGSECINSAGVIAGDYSDSNGVSHGYVRAHDGAFTTFDVPGAGTRPGQGTAQFGAAINPAGATTGNYSDANGVFHGFLRTHDGTISTFDPPGSVFTFPASINPAAMITGSYVDANGVGHGFLRIPHGK
jgi:hypothetical protein